MLNFLQMGNCEKSVRIWSFSAPYFPSFELNTERYGVSLGIQSECGKTRTRKTPNTDTFYAVENVSIFSYLHVVHLIPNNVRSILRGYVM